MLEEATQKFLAGDAAAPWPGRFAPLIADRHGVIVEVEDAGIGDGDAEHVAGEIVKHGRLACGPGGDVHDPGFAPGAEGRTRSGRCRRSRSLSLPRMSLAKALGGTRKPRRAGHQERRSGDTPPPVTRQWTCG